MRGKLPHGGSLATRAELLFGDSVIISYSTVPVATSRRAAGDAGR